MFICVCVCVGVCLCVFVHVGIIYVHKIMHTYNYVKVCFNMSGLREFEHRMQNKSI